MGILTDFLISPTAAVLARTIIHFLWQGALIAVGLRLVLLAISNRYANYRYTASCAAFLLMLVAPVITWSFVSGASLPPSEWHMEHSPAPADDVVPSLQEVVRESNAESPPYHYAVIVFLYGIGASVMLVRYLGGLAYAEYLYRRTAHQVEAEWRLMLQRLRWSMRIRRRVRLFASPVLESPCVLGYFAPIILVPLSVLTALPPEQVKAILAHELAHIRRADYVVNLVQSLAESLLFFHPAVWWISAQIRKERECCCDDEALKESSSISSYARTLLALEEWRVGRQPAIAFSGGNVSDRIHRLVHPDPARPSRGMIAVILLAVVTTFVACEKIDLTEGSDAGEYSLPLEISDAARRGDSERALTWLHELKQTNSDDAIAAGRAVYALADDEDLRISLAHFFASLFTEAGDEMVISIIRDDPSMKVQTSAVGAFRVRLTGPVQQNTSLSEIESRKAGAMRRYAVVEKVQERLLELVRDRSAPGVVRFIALKTLEPSPALLSQMIALYEGPENTSLRASLLGAIGEHGVTGVRYLDQIIRIERDTILRRGAVRGLWRSEAAEAVPILVRIAQEDRELRIDALRALNSMIYRAPGAREAVEELRRSGIETSQEQYLDFP